MGQVVLHAPFEQVVIVEVTVVCLVTVDLKLLGPAEPVGGGGGGLLEAAAATQMLCTQLSPQEQSWSVMQPTLIPEGDGEGIPPAKAGAARARIASAVLKIISTGLIVGLFLYFKK